MPGGAARGLVFTTAKSGFSGGKNSGFIGVFEDGRSKNSQKHLPVSKVGLTGILIVCLAAKIAASIAAFVWGLRRNAITACAVGWIVGGWLVCGLFVAGYAWHVCNATDKTDLWIWIALGGFLILPLADLAIAPLALAWNRHR